MVVSVTRPAAPAFETVLRRCIDEGLVGGEGSSLIQADASE